MIVTLTGGSTNAQAISLGTVHRHRHHHQRRRDADRLDCGVLRLSVLEDGATNLVYTVTLDHASAFDTTVNYSVGGTATEGSDYTGTTTHSITILAGETSGTITVDPTADTTFENNETVDRHADRRQHQRARRSASTRRHCGDRHHHQRRCDADRLDCGGSGLGPGRWRAPTWSTR